MNNKIMLKITGPAYIELIISNKSNQVENIKLII